MAIKSRKQLEAEKAAVLAPATKTAINPDDLIREKERAEKKKEVQRLPIDFPKYLYDFVRDESQLRGQSMRDFVVSMVRAAYESKQG